MFSCRHVSRLLKRLCLVWKKGFWLSRETSGKSLWRYEENYWNATEHIGFWVTSASDELVERDQRVASVAGRDLLHSLRCLCTCLLCCSGYFSLFPSAISPSIYVFLYVLLFWGLILQFFPVRSILWLFDFRRFIYNLYDMRDRVFPELRIG